MPVVMEELSFSICSIFVSSKPFQVKVQSFGQESGGDSETMTLRQALQKIERDGVVDYSVGGHSCERPPEVAQGLSDDCFKIAPDPDNLLVWRANAVQVRHLKASNAASFFTWEKLEASCLCVAARCGLERFRVLSTEDCWLGVALADVPDGEMLSGG